MIDDKQLYKVALFSIAFATQVFKYSKGGGSCNKWYQDFIHKQTVYIKPKLYYALFESLDYSQYWGDFIAILITILLK